VDYPMGFQMNDQIEDERRLIAFAEKVLQRGKEDVLTAIGTLYFRIDQHADQLVAGINFKSDIEREICRDCAKAGFASALVACKTICEKELRVHEDA